MKYGTRELNGASCKVLKPTALPVHMHNDIREITKVEVPADLRRQGLATALMESVCREADKFKMVLILTVEPYGDGAMSREDLAEWYATTFNFHELPGSPGLMARMFSIYIKRPLSQAIEGVTA